MATQEYDLLVIGAGPGGSEAANVAAASGARVALVERDKLGGTCLNYGCDPTKTMLHSAHLLHRARHAAPYGLQIPSATADWPALQARVRAVIEHIRGGSNEAAEAELARKGIDLVWGEARFLSAHEVEVDDRVLRAQRIIIATGSTAVVPPIKGLSAAGFITNVQAVSLPTLPRRLAVIGGGPIGVEFAQLFHRLGVAVTMLEQGDGLLVKDDRELADGLRELLAAEGIRIETGVEVKGVEPSDGGKRLHFQRGNGGEQELLVDEILVAVGYQPAIGTLNLSAAAVATSDGALTVDATLRTSVAHIWAVGDVTGGYPFTHVASEQGRLASSNAFAAEPQPFNDHAIPWVTYSDPELAHVGKTEQQLRDEGVAYRIGRKPMAELARAIATGQTDGLVKLLVDEHGAILGAHILAANAGELLAPLVLAMRAGVSAAVLAATILPYPTLAESVRQAAAATKH